MSTRGAPRDDDAPDTVRLDKWLWAARFYKTRTLAAEAADLGRARVNGQKVKPAKALHVDDLVTMRVDTQDREVRVLILADVRASAPIAQTRYVETETSRVAREAAEARRRLQREPAVAIKGRPTKRDRRELALFIDSGRDPDGF